jgi:hypothetical protein
MKRSQTGRKIVITGIKPWHVVLFVISGIVIVASFGFLVGMILGR